jgi:cell pole-organizing protein PopZ
MSDPMTNVEIEDVLSSIRRLVAEGTPGKAAVSSKPPRTMPKLVLTPALRVDTSLDATPAQVQGDGAAPIKLQEAQRVDAFAPQSPALVKTVDPASERLNLLATIAELEAAVRDQADEWEPDGTGTPTEFSWARAGFRGDVPVEDAEEVVAAPANVSAWPRTLVEAAKRYGDAENDPEDDAVGGDVRQEPEALQDKSDESELTESVAFRHHTTSAPADEAEFNDDLIGGPDLGEDPEAMLDSYLSDDAIIDEAMLRDIVRDIVRQELQGKLGERITRNVRKMVRREIHRALTTQSFD